jgi:hypothetical protein
MAPPQKGKLKDRMVKSMRRKRGELIGVKYEWTLFNKEKATDMLSTYALGQPN